MEHPELHILSGFWFIPVLQLEDFQYVYRSRSNYHHPTSFIK